MPKLHPTAFVAACVLACAGWLAARPDENARAADRYMRAQAVAVSFSGTVLVARGDDIVFESAHGYADIERGTRNDLATQYRIGSVTKSFTAALILTLQEDGLLAVGDALCGYLEDCPPAWAPISIHHLLSHTSGIPSFTDRPDHRELAARPASREEILATFRDLPLAFVPGDEFGYSNSNYYLLGTIVERVTGRPYADALTERILAPAGLEATFMSPSSPSARALAIGYRPADDGSLEPDAPRDVTWSAAAGGLHSTAADLVRFARAFDDDGVLTATSRSLMWTPVAGTYGYGWNVLEPQPQTLNRHVRMHSGRTPGFTACLALFLEEDLTVVVLSNNVMADTCTIVKDLAAIVLGEPYKTPIARRAIKLDAAILDRYAGRYRLGDELTVRVTREGDLLAMQIAESPDRFQLFAESPTEFFFKTFDAQVRFDVNRAGDTQGFAAILNDQQMSAERIGD